MGQAPAEVKPDRIVHSDLERRPDFSVLFADRVARIDEIANVLNDLLNAPPDSIRLGGGFPPESTFPRDEEILVIFGQALDLYNRERQLPQYTSAAGLRILRETAVPWLRDLGVDVVGPENVLITNGSQEALELLGKILINPDDRVGMEDVTYIGALQAFNAYEPEYVTIKTDEFGMTPESLEEVLVSGVKFVYGVPTFHNPTGKTMPRARREKIAALLKKYHAVMIEDDPYGQLRFEGERPPTIQSLAPDNVIYLTTMSKVGFPSLRVGYVVVPDAIVAKELINAKQGNTLCSSGLLQAFAAVYLQEYIQIHVRDIIPVYRAGRDAMLEALEQSFSKGCTWTRPEGGMFIWVTMPEGVDGERVWQRAREQGVAIVPGYPFFPEKGKGRNTMRLNFSNQPPENIRKAITIVGKIISGEMSAFAPQDTLFVAQESV